MSREREVEELAVQVGKLKLQLNTILDDGSGNPECDKLKLIHYLTDEGARLEVGYLRFEVNKNSFWGGGLPSVDHI